MPQCCRRRLSSLTLSPPTFDNAPISRTIRSGTEPYEADDANQPTQVHLWRQQGRERRPRAQCHTSGGQGVWRRRHLIRQRRRDVALFESVAATASIPGACPLMPLIWRTHHSQPGGVQATRRRRARASRAAATTPPSTAKSSPTSKPPSPPSSRSSAAPTPSSSNQSKAASAPAATRSSAPSPTASSEPPQAETVDPLNEIEAELDRFDLSSPIPTCPPFHGGAVGYLSIRSRSATSSLASSPPHSRPARPARGALPVRRHRAPLRSPQARDQGRHPRTPRRRCRLRLPRRRVPHRPTGRAASVRPADPTHRRAGTDPATPAAIRSNMEREAYFSDVKQIIDYVIAGRHHPVRLLPALLARHLRPPLQRLPDPAHGQPLALHLLPRDGRSPDRPEPRPSCS